MAYRCNMSLTSFKRRFAEYYEVSPHCWQIEQRLAKAVDLLLLSDLSIKEVGHECHFANISHFIKLFRRHYGVTPGDYRRSRDKTLGR